MEATPWQLVRVYAALMALFAVTFALSFVSLGILNLPVALAFSVAKTWLVLRVFMELKERSRIVNLFAGTGFFWLGILLLLVLSDYLTR